MPNGPAKFTRSVGEEANEKLNCANSKMWTYWNSQGALVARVTQVYPTFSGTAFEIPVYIAELFESKGNSTDLKTPTFYAAGWYKTFRQADKVIKDLLLKGDK